MIRKNILSILVALVILYLSLVSSETLDKIPIVHFQGMDKVVHFGMYAVLTGVMLYENREKIYTRGRLILLALIPAVFGGVIELMQSWFTTTRTGSLYDLLFNISGIIFSIIIYLLAKNSGREKII
ncbi:MAG: VanZ family protein [Bacteroidales bacterium]